VTARYVRESKSEKTEGLDIPGAILVTGGLMVLVYAVTVSQSTSLFSDSVLEPLGLAAAILAGFLPYERRQAESPLTPIEFMTRRNIFFLL
jgi:hypothetical protein